MGKDDRLVKRVMHKDVRISGTSWRWQFHRGPAQIKIIDQEGPTQLIFK